jgi:uncharacterized protein DUF6894
MALYFFDYRQDGKFIPDPVGTECANDDAAREEAVAALAEMAADLLVKYIPGTQIAYLVRRADGAHMAEAEIVFELRPPEVVRS